MNFVYLKAKERSGEKPNVLAEFLSFSLNEQMNSLFT